MHSLHLKKSRLRCLDRSDGASMFEALHIHKRGLRQCLRINDGISNRLTCSSQIPLIANDANGAFMIEMYKTVDAGHHNILDLHRCDLLLSFA